MRIVTFGAALVLAACGGTTPPASDGDLARAEAAPAVDPSTPVAPAAPSASAVVSPAPEPSAAPVAASAAADVEPPPAASADAADPPGAVIGAGAENEGGEGFGRRQGIRRGRRRGVPQVRIGNAVATGDLDKNIIRRYIRRKLPRIKYCYEKQLLRTPGIRGTVRAQFQIAPQGRVLSSRATGVHPDVANCVAGVIRTIKFPKPKGGGLVQVKYPFTFKPTGG